MKQEKKQAVVIIHGIGEQQPMDTLRGFVKAILPESQSNNQPKFYSKPDRMSESFELRKLTVPSTKDRPSTDFYEYYWAYLMSGTTYQHVLHWLKQLLFKMPNNLPKKLVPIWAISWGLLFIAFLLMSGLYDGFSNKLSESIQGNLILSLFPITAFAVLNIMLRYIGDAARYLSPSHENIAQRHKIRSNGIALLRNLHCSKEYDRIVVVGHSLGSIIGYDIIRHLWVDFNERYENLDKIPVDFVQEALNNLQNTGKNLDSNKNVDQFQAEQRELWLEQRALGNPWLVTDFITLGSPLVYAQLLLARSEPELKERQGEGELPNCPPDDRYKPYSYLDMEVASNMNKRIYTLHHAAPFACTKWTNIFFPGDIIAGALNGVFGAGIRDICVQIKECKVLNYTPLTHIWYWQKRDSIEILRKILELDCKSMLEKIK